MAQPHTTTTPTASQRLAAYEDQVVATNKAWREYKMLAAQADELSVLAGEAFRTYNEANQRRNDLFDAYWATYDVAA